jgi:hypothetical protein
VTDLELRTEQALTGPQKDANVQAPLWKFVGLLAMAGLLAVLTLILSAIPLRVVRRVYGAVPYWLGAMGLAVLLVSTGQMSLVLGFVALATLVGLYSEVEEQGGSIAVAGLASLATTAGLGVLGWVWYLRSKSMTIPQFIAQYIEAPAKTIVTANPGLPMSEAAIVQQFPSALVVASLMTLLIALIWETPLMRWLGLRPSEPLRPSRLLMFRVPDAFVWITIFSLLGAFYQHGNSTVEIASVNLLNIMGAAFFLQGLAILVVAFEIYRLSPIWRVLVLAAVMFYLFFVVAAVGFADFWLDLRQRLLRLQSKGQARPDSRVS